MSLYLQYTKQTADVCILFTVFNFFLQKIQNRIRWTVFLFSIENFYFCCLVFLAIYFVVFQICWFITLWKYPQKPKNMWNLKLSCSKYFWLGLTWKELPIITLNDSSITSCKLWNCREWEPYSLQIMMDKNCPSFFYNFDETFRTFKIN